MYQLSLDGWENPAHGVLDLLADGRQVGEGIDWYCKRTRERSHSGIVEVNWTGLHKLMGRCDRSNADEDRPMRHWICLKRIRMQRLGPMS